MKVLICESARHKNPYIKKLAEAYTAHGAQVYFGVENFFHGSLRPDLVHFHWPESLYKSGYKLKPVADSVTVLEKRIHEWKNHGTVVAYTLHNVTPHRGASEFDRLMYDAFLRLADIVVHHGNASISTLKRPQGGSSTQVHVVCPHGPYDTEPFDPIAARRRYRLPESKFVLLNFGKQRLNKGARFVTPVFRRLRAKEAHLFIIGERDRVKPGRSLFSRALRRITERLDPVRDIFVNAGSSFHTRYCRYVSDTEIPAVVHAADVVFLGHQSGLTSGIIALAASYGKPVVFPELGNFTEQLNGFDWWESYEPANLDSAVRAIRRMLDRLSGVKPGNTTFDNSEWKTLNSWDTHVSKILNECKTL